MSGRLKLLTDSLVILASMPDNQLAHLRALGVPFGVDELALEYDDIALAAESMFCDGELNEVQRDTVLELNDILKRMSGAQNAHLWTIRALRTAPEWSNVRQAAVRCLQQFQE